MITENIALAFEEMQKFVTTTITFAGVDIDCVDAEADIVAELVEGGLDHDITGAVVVMKTAFASGTPPVGAKFVKGVHICRIENIATDFTDPTLTIVYSLINSDPDSSHLDDPSLLNPEFPCLIVDGGDAEHDCD
jgi:hypothetical protein